MTLREPWRTRLLFLSFAVNLVLLPIAAAPLFLPHPGFMPPSVPGGPPRPVVMFERISRILSEDDRSKLKSAVEPHFEDIDIARIRMEAARGAMLRAIGHTPYDADALRAAMQTWQQAWQTWSDQFGAAFVDAVGQVSPEGRQRLSQAGHRRPLR